MTMKQTLELAAFEYAENIPFGDLLTSSRQTCEDAFKAGAEWQKRQTPWISVKDKLPETDDDMYICLDTKMQPHGIGVCEYDSQIRLFIDNLKQIKHPTHWMYIPKSPKGGKE